MNISNKTVLITGGGSGIGYAIAKLLSEKGNRVIIIGRNAEKIKKAGNQLKVTAIPCDISMTGHVEQLVRHIKAEFADLSVLINNAGVAHIYQVGEGSDAYEKAKKEFDVNYFAPVLLAERLLPILKKQPEAAIVNITSNTVYHPAIVMPTYSDTKAALHSHTLALRYGLAKDTAIKVFEVSPSLINTEPVKALGGEKNGLPPSAVAEALLKGVEKDTYEIYVGDTAGQREAYLSDPQLAFENFNKGL